MYEIRRQSFREISIHTPRVGSDHLLGIPTGLIKISIHTPRVGSDERWEQKPSSQHQFQSTLPVWGATVFKL